MYKVHARAGKCDVLRARMRRYLFPFSFLKEPPYLLRLPSISVISGIKLANMACNMITDAVSRTHPMITEIDHTHTHDFCLLAVYLLPCSFLYEPPYLLRVPRMSIISGMKLANIAWRPRETAQTALESSWDSTTVNQRRPIADRRRGLLQVRRCTEIAGLDNDGVMFVRQTRQTPPSVATLLAQLFEVEATA